MGFKVTVQTVPPQNGKYSDTIYEQTVELLDLVKLVLVVNGVQAAEK